MVNTLLNIEKTKSSVWGLDRILVSLKEVELTNRLNPNPSIELQSKIFVDKEIKATSGVHLTDYFVKVLIVIGAVWPPHT